jgi:tetratricopeptide (TPR) repeat protein
MALYPDWTVIAAALWKAAPTELMEPVGPPLATGTPAAPAGETPKALPTDAAPADKPAQEGAAANGQAAAGVAVGREARWQLMERLWRFDRALVTEHQSGAVVESWLKNALREASRVDEAAPYAASQLSALALRLGLRDLALTLAISGKGANALADGALAKMQKNALSEAVQWWAQAVRAEPRQHEWLLKYISACSMIGEVEKAQALERSRWLRPLAVQQAGISYLMVANNLQEQGLFEEARQYGAAAFEMLDSDNPQMLLTARIYGEILEELEDYERSANVHRTANALLLSDPNSGYSMSVIQHFVAQEFLARAVAELDRGEVDSALDRITRFERLRPAGVDICEHTYARLLKQGRKAAADELFERCSKRMLDHLDRWPDDAGSHNNLAWMYARCDQRLEEALGHAQLAVKLSSRAPTYIDTLAEAHFRLGHYDEAIELAEECVKLDPRHHHYRKQLERFREARRQRDS